MEFYIYLPIDARDQWHSVVWLIPSILLNRYVFLLQENVGSLVVSDGTKADGTNCALFICVVAGFVSVHKR